MIGAHARALIRLIHAVWTWLIRHSLCTHGTGDDDRLAMDDRWRHVWPVLLTIMLMIVSGSFVGVMIMTIIDADPDPQRDIRPGCYKPCAQHERAQG